MKHSSCTKVTRSAIPIERQSISLKKFKQKQQIIIKKKFVKGTSVSVCVVCLWKIYCKTFNELEIT